MAYITDHEHSVDRKTSTISFCDDATPLCSYSLANNVVTISARDGVEVVAPTWGTNKDINEWFNLITSMSGRYELVEGLIRDDYEYSIELDDAGVVGSLMINGVNVGDWAWVFATDTLTIGARVENSINWAELRSYVQWMRHFQYAVQNYGG